MSASDRDKWNTRYLEGAYSGRTRPSVLLADWIDEIPRGRALDVACGAGRNALYLAARGFEVDAVDVSGEALKRATARAQDSGLSVNWREHDLDLPLALDNSYRLILVIRYVNLPLIRDLVSRIAPGGFLLCEQHLLTDADVIGPTDPAYRVRPGDLLATAGSLKIHYLQEDIVPDADGRTAALARLVAQKIPEN